MISDKVLIYVWSVRRPMGYCSRFRVITVLSTTGSNTKGVVCRTGSCSSGSLPPLGYTAYALAQRSIRGTSRRPSLGTRESPYSAGIAEVMAENTKNELDLWASVRPPHGAVASESDKVATRLVWPPGSNVAGIAITAGVGSKRAHVLDLLVCFPETVAPGIEEVGFIHSKQTHSSAE